MDLLAIIRIAMRALARNKLRSALTMLGIIIGVGAVIAMVSVGQGAQEQAQQQIAAMGSNMLFVQSGDRKSTRLNSSHTVISYAVFCLKKKRTTRTMTLFC